jgi:hypothetical protein
MSSKDWIEKTITKPGAAKHDDTPGKRARLVETLLKMRKEKG